MHFSKAFTFAAIVLVGSAFAAPNPAKSKPVKPSAPITQTNSCGDGTVYCCNGGDGSSQNLGTCALSVVGICNSGSTTICCQAINSIQTCLAGATTVIG